LPLHAPRFDLNQFDVTFHTFPHLETARLHLRRILASDANALFRVLADESVTQFYDEDAFTDISQALDQIEAWDSGYHRHSCIRWGITLMGTGDVIGSCGFYGIHIRHRRAGIGFELARDFWRQGIMTEALSAVIAYGFDELELNRIEAVVMPGNVASIAMLGKLGFRNEGLLEAYERWGSKGFVNLYILALLRKTWANG
jgi:ribosomal-protein-alanine N-acetyltransferase